MLGYDGCDDVTDKFMRSSRLPTSTLPNLNDCTNAESSVTWISLIYSIRLKYAMSRLTKVVARSSCVRQPLRLGRPFSSDAARRAGENTKEHVTNKSGELDVQSAASKSGKGDRIADEKHSSQASTERDQGHKNEKAKKDHPEAPGPVIGMNDERGGVCLGTFCSKDGADTSPERPVEALFAQCSKWTRLHGIL